VAASPQIRLLTPSENPPPVVVVRPAELPESARVFCQVFRGRELTRKTRRIESGLAPLDRLIEGGVVRGRISEIIGPTGAGKTSLAMAFAATATRTEAAAWIETRDSLDPASMIAAGVEPARLLWVSCSNPYLPRRRSAVSVFDDDPAGTTYRHRQQQIVASLRAAEWILAAGGFGLIVIDFDQVARFIPQNTVLRLARAAERSGAAIIVLAHQRMCGTFAALSLELNHRRRHFNRIAPGACSIFDGQTLEARILRNKLGGAGGTARWSIAIDPHSDFAPVEEARPANAIPRKEPVKIVAGASI